MTSSELQVVFTIQQHLLRQNYLSEKQKTLLNRVQKQIKNCMREITIRDGKKDKE